MSRIVRPEQLLTGPLVLGYDLMEWRAILDKTVFTLQQLSEFDGKAGRKAYVGYKGKVYDVSDSFLWQNGDHEGFHVAGRDLTDDMSGAPHGDEDLSSFAIVGDLA